MEQKNIWDEYHALKSENIALKEDNERLYNALKEVIKWAKIKDGKFTFVTSDIQANDFKEAITLHEAQ